MIKESIAAAALSACGIVGGVVTAPPAVADGSCETVLWGFLGSQRRSICDGPIKPDGSWWRQRSIWVPPHNVPMSCYTSGGNYSSYTTCSGGYFEPYRETAYDSYPVTPDSVLSDEPGHLG